ncbi:Cytochrome c1 heme lyase [Tulasnella sp. UAMH 9824]|nr:Cytochrome c1 heme lyase [Tulasnella sp. UAMH 9824]
MADTSGSHSHSEESTQGKCPVDHASREKWANLNQSAPGSNPHHFHQPAGGLPMDRETSSIPRLDGENWVYPSQAQFYDAMARKNHNPRADDMRVVVPIHNAVNERAWQEVLKWETGRGAEKCGGLKLVSFKGNAHKLTPKARLKMLFGYQAPFDRHDWLVDRCGVRTRYVIDFYTGRADSNTPSPTGNTSFYLDVRPALDNFEGIKMRFGRFWDQWFGNAARPTQSS